MKKSKAADLKRIKKFEEFLASIYPTEIKVMQDEPRIYAELGAILNDLKITPLDLQYTDTATGLLCRILRHPVVGFLRGYIYLAPSDHQDGFAFDKDKWNAENPTIEITCDDLIIEERYDDYMEGFDGYRTIGFDCGQHNDLKFIFYSEDISPPPAMFSMINQLLGMKEEDNWAQYKDCYNKYEYLDPEKYLTFFQEKNNKAHQTYKNTEHVKQRLKILAAEIFKTLKKHKENDHKH